MTRVGPPRSTGSAARLTATVVRPGAPVGPQTATTRPLPGTTSGASTGPGDGSSGSMTSGSASSTGTSGAPSRAATASATAAEITSAGASAASTKRTPS